MMTRLSRHFAPAAAVVLALAGLLLLPSAGHAQLGGGGFSMTGPRQGAMPLTGMSGSFNFYPMMFSPMMGGMMGMGGGMMGMMGGGMMGMGGGMMGMAGGMMGMGGGMMGMAGGMGGMMGMMGGGMMGMGGMMGGMGMGGKGFGFNGGCGQ